MTLVTSLRPKSPNMRAIAKALGVSTTTVSHALSGKRHVSPETAERIKAYVQSAGYTQDSAALSLRSGRRMLIGLAGAHIANPSFARIAQGVEEVATAADYGVLIFGTDHHDSRHEQRYFNLLRNGTIDGLIYSAGRQISVEDDIVEMATSYRIVLADEPADTHLGLPMVSSANREGGRLAGAHLRALGHHRAAIVAGPAELLSTKERVAGFKEFFPDAIVVHGNFEFEHGVELTGALIASGAKFTCLFACNDMMAIGAMRALTSLDHAVPEQVSIVGFDDTVTAHIVSPMLTTIRQQMTQIGAASAQLLLDMLRDATFTPAGPSLLPVELVIRETTASAR